MNDGTVLRRADGVEIKELDGQTILLDTRDNSIHVLNSTGAAVWKLCDGSTDFTAIVGEIDRLFDVPVGVDLRADIISLVESLVRRNLLI